MLQLLTANFAIVNIKAVSHLRLCVTEILSQGRVFLGTMRSGVPTTYYPVIKSRNTMSDSLFIYFLTKKTVLPVNKLKEYVNNFTFKYKPQD